MVAEFIVFDLLGKNILVEAQLDTTTWRLKVCKVTRSLASLRGRQAYSSWTYDIFGTVLFVVG